MLPAVAGAFKDFGTAIHEVSARTTEDNLSFSSGLIVPALRGLRDCNFLIPARGALIGQTNMRKRSALALMLCATSGIGHAAQQATPRKTPSASQAPESILRKLDETELAAIRKRDVAFVDRLYAADVTLFPVYSLVKVEGRASAKEAWQSFYDRFAAIQKCEWSERVYRAAGPSAAWMTCLWSLSGTNSDGQAVELLLRATRLYERRRGQWFVVHENFSVPQR